MLSFLGAFRSIPDEVATLLQTGFSGAFLIVAPLAFRAVFRPRLKVSFHHDGDARHEVPALDPRGRKIEQSQYRLRVENRGFAKLVSPRVWCLAISASSGALSKRMPFTVFEMQWSETDRDFQVGALIPGRFAYRVDLGSLDTATIAADGTRKSETPETLLVKRRNEQDSIQLLPGLPYDLCLVVSNENFLVPSHYMRVRISWAPNGIESVGRHNIAIEVVEQGDLWLSRLIRGVGWFERENG